ncbi:MAG TPA: PQQ-binding-like beta-propeller repeat protein, partial [Gemmataceae bacterium]|nr:PQQ-binding-like beta-propeller repeat protein [Gemmataceae bacterium]
MLPRWIFTFGISVVCLPALAGASDWPQFRGPNGSATSAGNQLPVNWGADKNIAWKAQIPGYGWSSPIIWGDKVFVTTAVTDKQRKPSAGFGGSGLMGGGPGGFGGPLPTGQILPPFLQEQLNLTAEQKKQLGELQKEVDGKIDTILTDEQKTQLKDMREGGGRGGRGAGRFGGLPQPGQILPSSLQERLNLTPEQKKQQEGLQKEVDGKLEKVLTAEQQKQLK